MAKSATTHVDRLEQVVGNVRCGLSVRHEKKGALQPPVGSWF